MEVKPLHTKVEKVIQTLHGMIVLENPNQFPPGDSNLYCLSSSGTILWKAEKPEPYTLYSRVRLNEDGTTLATYTRSGHACDVELKTGKILSKMSIQ